MARRRRAGDDADPPRRAARPRRAAARAPRQSLQTAQRLDEVGRSNVDLRQFAFVAAHELATPLTVVAGAVETVATRYGERLPADVVDLLAAARQSSKRLQELIGDLLAYSRAGRGTELEPVALGGLVEDALDPLRAELEATEARLEVDELPVVLGDPGQLRLVFSNLVANALKYRSPGVPPAIEIRAEREDGLWRLGVADNGIGIDPERAEAVFAMFERDRPADDRSGSGIGLALCRRIVERHGGRIWIERGESGGTVVSFTLRAA